MLIDSEINLTQVAGIAAYGLACFAAFAAVRAKRAESAALVSRWRWIGILQLIFSLEVALGFRHLAHDLVNLTLHSMSLYQGRSSIQEMLLLGVGLFSFAAVVIVLWRWITNQSLRSDPSKAAVVWTAGTLLLFTVETVSLHAVDRFLYMPVGPILLIAYLWIAAALGVLLSARRTLSRGSPGQKLRH